jgi:hypothetical protein
VDVSNRVVPQFVPPAARPDAAEEPPPPPTNPAASSSLGAMPNGGSITALQPVPGGFDAQPSDNTPAASRLLEDNGSTTPGL